MTCGAFCYTQHKPVWENTDPRTSTRGVGIFFALRALHSSSPEAHCLEAGNTLLPSVLIIEGNVLYLTIFAGSVTPAEREEATTPPSKQPEVFVLLRIRADRSLFFLPIGLYDWAVFYTAENSPYGGRFGSQ